MLSAMASATKSACPAYRTYWLRPGDTAYAARKSSETEITAQGRRCPSISATPYPTINRPRPIHRHEAKNVAGAARKIAIHGNADIGTSNIDRISAHAARMPDAAHSGDAPVRRHTDSFHPTHTRPATR